VGFEFPKWFESPEDYILEPFEKVAQECVRDGAEAIVVACCALGPALTLAGYKEVGDTGAPVLDVATVAVKYAELLAEMQGLGISKSNVLTYQSIPAEMVDEFAKPFFIT
jgi:Asp/Glu/hydantoin racemase